MRKLALICILIFMTLSLAFAQIDRNLTTSITNPANTLSTNISKPMLLEKPVFDLSQRGGQSAKFTYNVGKIKPVFDVSQRAGRPTVFNYTTGWIKPVYEVSAYSRIKPMYNISQFSRIKPLYQVSEV